MMMTRCSIFILAKLSTFWSQACLSNSVTHFHCFFLHHLLITFIFLMKWIHWWVKIIYKKFLFSVGCSQSISIYVQIHAMFIARNIDAISNFWIDKIRLKKILTYLIVCSTYSSFNPTALTMWMQCIHKMNTSGSLHLCMSSNKVIIK